MSDRFHSKFHNRNHHTYTSAEDPDAGADPIASPESPFLGDFILSGALSANAALSAMAGYFYSENTAIKAVGGTMGLDVKGSSCIDGNLHITGNIQAANYNIPTYEFGSGLLEISKSVRVKIDESTIKLNPYTGNLYADFSSASALPGYKYNTLPPLFSQTISEENGLTTSVLALSTDNETIFVENNKLVGINYNFTDGVAYNSINKTVSASVDDSSIKIIDGKISSGFSFNGTGLSENSQQVGVNIDNTTIKVSDGNVLYSGLIFDEGLVKGVGTRASNVSVNYDGVTIGLVNDRLAVLDAVKLSDPFYTQTIQGVLSFSNTISTLSGISFSDGSRLDSASFIKPNISGLGQLYGSSSHLGLVYTTDNRVIAWGRNSWDSTSMFIPLEMSVWPPQSLSFEISSIPTAKIKKLMFVGGYGSPPEFHYNSIVLDEAGKVYVTGAKPYWCGISGWKTDATRIYSFFNVKFPTETYIKEIAAAVGDTHTSFFAADSANFVYAWGENSNGLLGNNSFSNINTPTICQAAYHVNENYDNYAAAAITTDVNFLFDNTVNTVSGINVRKEGNEIAMVLRDIGIGTSIFDGIHLKGSLWACGTSPDGALGINDTLASTFKVCIEEPNLFSGVYQILQNGLKILNKNAFNSACTWILKEDGTVWASGNNSFYQLGVGASDTTSRSFFVKNQYLTNIKDMADVGSNATGVSMCAISNDGRIFSWGRNLKGECGQGHTDIISTPTETFLYPYTDSSTVKAVAIKGSQNNDIANTGNRCFGILASDGYLYVSGKGIWNDIPSISVDETLAYRFTRIDVKDVKDFEFVNANFASTDTMGILILTKSGDLFVIGQGSLLNYNYNFTGYGRSAYNPAKFTNYIV